MRAISKNQKRWGYRKREREWRLRLREQTARASKSGKKIEVEVVTPLLSLSSFFLSRLVVLRLATSLSAYLSIAQPR